MNQKWSEEKLEIYNLMLPVIDADTRTDLQREGVTKHEYSDGAIGQNIRKRFK